MQHVILVVSPDPDLIHQVQSHLEEGGRYQVTGATTAQDALSLANQNFYEIAILDGEIQDIPVAAFSRDLTALQTELKILVFPPENDPKDPSLDGLVTNGFLTKPFSGQEVGSALTRLLSDQSLPQQSQVDALDDLVKQWLEIPENGEKQARQILAATTAQSSLISIKGEIAAKSGNAEDELLGKVCDFLLRFWREEENHEVARYLGLEEEGPKFVYATKLVSNVVLVLVYAQTVPLQQVRRELNQVKRDLQKNYPSTNEIKQEIAQKTLARVHEQSKSLESMQPFSPGISQDELDALSSLENKPSIPFNSPEIPSDELDALSLSETKPSETTDSPGISQAEMDELNLLLAAMPAPDPQPGDESDARDGEEGTTPQWLNELQKVGVAIPAVEAEPAPDDANIGEETKASPPFIEPESQSILPVETEPALQAQNEVEEKQSSEEEDSPLPAIDFVLPWETLPEGPPKGEGEGVPSDSTTIESQSPSFEELLEGAEPLPDSIPTQTAAEPEPHISETLPQEAEDEIRFHYTCLLLPEDKSLFLTRDLSEKLGESLPQFHQAQGWQLVNMNIRPQYMLWTVSIPLQVCPHQVIHHIRSLTSAHIYANFPEIARKKTSEDFWSSEYLAVSGRELPPASLISDFVAKAWQVQAPTTSP